MAYLDPKFTQELVDWLNSDHSSDEKIREGADLLLRINRNRLLYQQIMRTPQRLLKKLEYELKKHLVIRNDGLTLDDVQTMTVKLMPKIDAASKAIPEGAADVLPVVTPPAAGDNEQELIVAKGKRPDHDALPVDIQNIWPKNAERWKKIKELFELCKQLEQPCDRYEHLKVMKEAWYKYKDDMARYDDFKATDDTTEGENKKPELTEQEKESVNYAQSYISRYLPQLLELKQQAQEPDFSEEDQAKLEELREKLQNRVNTLLKYKVALTDQRKADLVSVDIVLENSSDNAEGEKTE
ncbi:MAG: hypothetical protein IJG07_05520 [Prevotella sp.]|nr:hypothetical protein [Prevotella sp.]